MGLVAVALLTVLAGIGFIVLRLRAQTIESMDFRYIWLAGDLWARHLNPYGPDYVAAGATRFPTGYPVAGWVYPYHWYVPARAAALLPPTQAFAVWLAVTTVALAIAGRWAIAAARAIGATPGIAMILFGIGYATTGSVVTFALREGQPAVPAACGVALCLYGVARDKRWMTVCGLVLAMLKPQLGLPFAAALCFMPRGLVTALIATAATILACVPAFLASGMADQVHGLLVSNSGNYQQVSVNTADMMSGLPHVIARLTGWSMSIPLSMVLAALAAAAATFLLRHRSDRERKTLFIGLTCAITVAVIGLHPFDLLIVLFTLPLLGELRPAQRWTAMAGFALFWRPEALDKVIPGDANLTPTVATAAVFLILAAWTMRAVHGGASHEPGTLS